MDEDEDEEDEDEEEGYNDIVDRDVVYQDEGPSARDIDGRRRLEEMMRLD